MLNSILSSALGACSGVESSETRYQIDDKYTPEHTAKWFNGTRDSQSRNFICADDKPFRCKCERERWRKGEEERLQRGAVHWLKFIESSRSLFLCTRHPMGGRGCSLGRPLIAFRSIGNELIEINYYRISLMTAKWPRLLRIINHSGRSRRVNAASRTSTAFFARSLMNGSHNSLYLRCIIRQTRWLDQSYFAIGNHLTENKGEYRYNNCNSDEKFPLDAYVNKSHNLSIVNIYVLYHIAKMRVKYHSVSVCSSRIYWVVEIIWVV